MSRLLICSVICVLAGLAAPLAADDKSTEQPASNWKLVISEDFASSPSSDWHLNKGTWQTVDGAWQGAEVPAEKHGAVARRDLKFTDAKIEFDLKFDGAKTAQLSINDAKSHVCRLQITPKSFRVMKDDHDGPKGPEKGQVLSEQKVDLKPGTWHHVRLQIKGSEMTAQVDDVSGQGEHAQIALAKANFAFVVSGQTASFRNLRVSTPAE